MDSTDGDEHEATAHALNQLGSVLARKESWAEAQEMFEGALCVIQAARQGKRKMKWAIHEAHAMHNLACVLVMRKEEKQRGLELGRECVHLCETLLGATHDRTIYYKNLWEPGFHTMTPKEEFATNTRSKHE